MRSRGGGRRYRRQTDLGSATIFDHLRDPDDPALLDPAQARALATRVESARLAAGAVRYGRVGKVGVANVVVNRDNPLPSGNHACGLDGTAAQVATTMLRLEETFADLGRAEAVVIASPTTVPEIDGIADDTGWHAAAEEVAVVHRITPAEPTGDSGTEQPGSADQQDHPGKPADSVRQDHSAGSHSPNPSGPDSSRPAPRDATELDLDGIAELWADDLGLADSGLPKLRRHLTHLLDDPRWRILVLDDIGTDRIAGFALAFAHPGIGLLDQVVLRASRRRHGGGRALAAAALDVLHGEGAEFVVGYVEEGSAAERFAEECGFDAAYPVVTYVRRIDELLGDR